MKKRTYIFNFKYFLKLLIILFFINILIFLIFKKINSYSDFRIFFVFNEKKIEKKNFFLGNSRSTYFGNNKIRESFYNLSYNEINDSTLELILNSLNSNPKYNGKNIFLEITSLKSGGLDCDYRFFYFEKYFDQKFFNLNCNKDKILLNIFRSYSLNSKFLNKSLFHVFFKKNEQDILFSKKMSSDLCGKNNFSYNDLFFEKNSLENLSAKLLEIKKKYKNLNFKFWILPIYNNDKLKLVETQLAKNFGEHNFLLFLGNFDKAFFEDCSNFSDHLHLSKIGLEIATNYFKFNE